MKIYLKQSLIKGASSPADWEVVHEGTVAAYGDTRNYKFYEVLEMKEVRAEIKILPV